MVKPAGVSEMARLDALARAERESPFLAGLIAAASRWDEQLAEPGLPTGRRLRLERRQLALRVALDDLAGAADLSAVTAALTDFADRALDEAIAAAIEERTPGAGTRGFVAIALGKQGSRELNYSSDIDPIFLYDPDTLATRPREDPADAAVRVGRRVLELLQTRDRDGYVLRVDLRLRPSPEVTPIAVPVEAAIAYYESQALPWERAAFIRARTAAGDRALGGRFLDAIRPFVWRRSLDFGAVDEIVDITRRIRDHHAQGQRFGPGFDLKRGRGGIREVEFFAQVHQLIHGGREPELRAPATRDALAALAASGRIGAEEARRLSDAYTLLRTIEHRVQMIDDRQTHALPDGEGLDRVARLHGLADGAALLALLAPHVAAVADIFDRLAPDRGAGLPHAPDALAQALASANIGDVQAAMARIAAWREGRYPALRSPAAQRALEAVLPALMEALSRAPVPDAALQRLDRVLERMTSAINVFRLLEARPALAQLLIELLSHAAPLAEELGRRPDLLDGLIDTSALAPVGDLESLQRELCPFEHDAPYETRLEHVRRVVGDKRFALGSQIVAGAADPLAVSAGYARVAEAALCVLADAAVAEFERAHGRVPGGELVILALGRLGGGRLTHASDLDLVYLFTGDFLAESDGARPLGATLYFNRLAQRVTAALSVPTAAGPLYSVDTRLRPSGAQGPLVVTLESFATYHRESAWTWEHMALTRARPVYGSPEARAALSAIVGEVLAGARPARDVAADAHVMRADMARHKPPAGPLDAKLLSGGLVDLEFAVHVAQLVHRTALAPDLADATRALASAGLIDPRLVAAMEFLARLLVVIRLVAPDAQVPEAPATRALMARALQMTAWDEVVARLAEVRDIVGAAWQGSAHEHTSRPDADRF